MTSTPELDLLHRYLTVEIVRARNDYRAMWGCTGKEHGTECEALIQVQNAVRMLRTTNGQQVLLKEIVRREAETCQPYVAKDIVDLKALVRNRK